MGVMIPIPYTNGYSVCDLTGYFKAYFYQTYYYNCVWQFGMIIVYYTVKKRIMELKDLVGKSWIIDGSTVLINVTGVDVFKSSYDGVAGEVHADGIYKIKKSTWLDNSIAKRNGSFTLNTKVCQFKEVSYMQAVGFVKTSIYEIFNDIMII